MDMTKTSMDGVQSKKVPFMQKCQLI